MGMGDGGWCRGGAKVALGECEMSGFAVCERWGVE